MAYRLTGSSDLYERDGRRPYASINFVTAHDGFTLRDLVSYNDKHNEANGEDNHDGADDNQSWNCGIEGPTDDADILALRARQQRNFLATLFLSQGVPMLLAGDEMGRTQQGNNNAYCQDNELTWIDWDLDPSQQELLTFTKRVIENFRQHPALRRRHFFYGRQIRGSEIKDITWFRPDGEEMEDDDWANPEGRCLGLRLAGDIIEETDERGHAIVDDTLLILLNAHHEPVSFVLPQHKSEHQWEGVLDTREPTGKPPKDILTDDHVYELEGRSLALLRTRLTPEALGEEESA
jgi:glycogen operon protein